ncbi:MAG: ATP-binding protein [Nitriliruptorales bacterium]
MEFYESDEFLVASGVQFLAPALAGGDAAIIVATSEHRQKFEAALVGEGLDITTARRRGQLIDLDAGRTLAGFMEEGVPDPERFRALLSGLMDEAIEGGRRLRIYGEMVALLWEEGNIPAAIALEDLWNELAENRDFTLMCAYPMRVFTREESGAPFRTVCQQHTDVIPGESYSKLTDPHDRLRAVALLQQEASAGIHESRALRRKQNELEVALDRLRELDRLRNEFVAMVVHDIRTPATLISEFLRLVRDGRSEFGDAEIEEYLTKASNNAAQIERLVADILTMARIDSGEFSYDLRAIDLGSLVERVVNGMRSATGRSIELSRGSPLPAVLADEVRQVQILNNLLTNALKFSPQTSTVHVSVVDRGDHLVISVRDEGVGINPDDLPQLFRPFSRLAERGNGTVEGIGMGLHIAKALAEGQGGTISVDTVKGEGSTFSYTVPAAAPPR